MRAVSNLPPMQHQANLIDQMQFSLRERTARLLDGLIFLALLALIALTAIPYGTVDPWWEAVFECAAFTLAALSIVKSLLSGTWWINEYRLLVPLFALALFALAQSLPVWKLSSGAALGPAGLSQTVSADPFETRRFALKLLAVALTLGLLLRHTSNAQRLRALIYLVIGVAVASALFGLLREELPPGLLGSASYRLLPDASYGQFENRNHFAYLMEMALGLVLGLGAFARAWRRRLFVYVFAGIPLWTALMLTHSRGAVFSLLCQLLFFVFLFSLVRPAADYRWQSNHPLERRGARWFAARATLVACLLAAMAASVLLIGGDEMISRLESTPAEFRAESTHPRTRVRRMEIWRATWQLIKANRLAGVGFGGYQVALPQYQDSAGEWTPEQAHNDYLEVLASGGIIGGALGAWFIVAFIRRARVRLRSADSFRRAACCGALAGLFAVAAHSLVDFGLHITVNALACVALIVIAIVHADASESAPLRYEACPSC